MRQYLDMCEHILKNGVKKEDRTGTGTLSVFGYQNRYDLSKGFPLVTTKDMCVPNKFGVSRIDGIIHELLWFLSGSTDIRYLVDNGVNIWNYDAYRFYCEKTKNGTGVDINKFIEGISNNSEFASHFADIGPIYGHQWRNWNSQGIDQISNLIDDIKKNPDSRRLIVSAWNVEQLPLMGLPPCHCFVQYYVANGKLSCQLYQRSGDVFLGVPYNIASYAFKTHMIAQQTGLEVGDFVHTFGDCHIYLNHVDQIKTQLEREPMELPTLKLRKADSIFDYKRSDFELAGYSSHPELKGKVSF